jgi:hydroxyacylglutathione hydrolase
MWGSLQKLLSLPDDTLLHCAHEYTHSNAMFALSVEPQNAALQARLVEVNGLRAQHLPTVPTTLALEKATNPFLRPSSPEIQRMIGLEGAPLVEVWAEVRRRKDAF